MGESEPGPGSRLTRSERIQRRRDFRRAYDEGRRTAGSLLVVFCAPNDLACHRLGITATRRVGGAVVRNRVRRRIREGFRRMKGSLPAGPWRDVVVNVRERAAKVGSAALDAELRSLLQRALRAS
jgi:ribonuclease P protein component